MSKLDLHKAKPVPTHGVKPNVEVDYEEPMNETDNTQFRALAARANYLAQDRGDIQFAVKELSRRMSSPASGDWIALKRLGRYLLGYPRMVAYFPYQGKATNVTVAVDSGWAGCARTGRSTLGGLIKLGRLGWS